MLGHLNLTNEAVSKSYFKTVYNITYKLKLETNNLTKTQFIFVFVLSGAIIYIEKCF